MKRGVFIPSDTTQRMTVKDALKRYRDEVPPWLAKGAKPDQSGIARVVDEFGGLDLAALDTSHVASYRDKRLHKDGASAQTAKHELGLLNRVLKQCIIDWGTCPAAL